MDEELKEFLSEDDKPKKPEIDWNIWHKKVKEAKSAFQIDDMFAVCRKLHIVFREDDPISVSGINEVLDDAMEWIIEHYNSKWDGYIKDEEKIPYHNFNYYLDEAGFITIEQHFKSMDNSEDIEYIDPYLKITLMPADRFSGKIEDLYFKIEFVIASQMW